MRLTRAIDRFLAWRELERDATPRSLDSYWRILVVLDEAYPDALLSDFEGRVGTEKIRAVLSRRWGRRSAATRANVISVYHAFFRWAVAEDLIEADPSQRIQRPPKRKPRVYRPTPAELERARAATRLHERAPWLLMEGVGLRVASVARARWRDVDLTRGRITAHVKGASWHVYPLAPDILAELREIYRRLQPAPDDHVFTYERELWADAEHRVRVRRDPKHEATPKAVWSMVRRVSERAGVGPLYPHQLRHGFATRLDRLGVDLHTVQFLMGHSRSDTTEQYLDERRLDEAAAALERIIPDDEAVMATS